MEYEDVMGRRELFTRSPLTQGEQQEMFNGFLAVWCVGRTLRLRQQAMGPDTFETSVSY